MTAVKISKRQVLSLSFSFFLVILVFVFFFSCQVVRYSQERMLLGTLVRIDICATRSEKKAVLYAFDRAWDRLKEIHERMNVYNQASDIAKINLSYPAPVKIHRDAYRLLALSRKYSALTRNAFDVTVWPLVALWKEAEVKQELPSAQEVKETLASVGSEKIELLDDDRVKLLDPRTKVDVSAIGQGYAADEAAAVLRAQKISRFLIDTGGEIVARGLNERGEPWTVGIRDPLSPGNIIETLTLSDRAVSTSGGYEKFYLIGQDKYSHILDPVTGYPVTRVVSATVIDDEAARADVFSTALCVLGRKGIRLVESLSEHAAILLLERDPKGEVRSYKNAMYKRMFRSF